MENAAEALKIAFAVLLFVMALTLSMSSFSEATRAVKAITTLRDRESQYTYVTPTQDLTRTVGIETVVSTIYRAYKENIKIYFFDSHGNPMEIYKIEESNGTLTPTSCIDYASENFANQQESVEFLDVLLGGQTLSNWTEIREKYQNRLCYTNGLYKEFSGSKFIEELGEYYEGTGAAEIKERIITYRLQS